MKRSFWREGFGAALLDLSACIVSFGLAALIDHLWRGDELLLNPEPEILPWALSAFVAWLALVFPESQWHEGARLWIDGFLGVLGTNLLVQFGLVYGFGMQPTSWLILVLGSFFSIAVVGALRKWGGFGLKDQGILLANFDELTIPLADRLHNQIVGLVANQAPSGRTALPILGSLDQLGEICQRKRPASLIVSGTPGAIPFAQLLQLHYSGINVKGATFLYEEVLHRVPWQYLRPYDLLFFLNPNASRSILAFQAVYKNLLGLALRFLFAPILVLTSLLVVITTKGPALEHIECLGYQQMPFQLLRFRIRQADGNLSVIGKWISRLHLTNLPHFINVVRGEMVLFGPAPVRTVFAERLNQLLPAYLYRFTVKPGIFGWAQTEIAGVPEETKRMECDFYYIRQESPSLDLSIALRMLLQPSGQTNQPDGVFE